jgi:hypothetical protein
MSTRGFEISPKLGACGWLVCGLVGCHVPGLVPDARTPADHALAIEPRCQGFTEERVAPLLSVTAIDSVEPAYSYVQSGAERQARLRGARITVKPLTGLSREALARIIECHEARVTLGRVAAGVDDPYVLADDWLDIDVDSEGDGFVVLVRADGMYAARRVLEKARRFSKHHE